LNGAAEAVASLARAVETHSSPLDGTLPCIVIAMKGVHMLRKSWTLAEPCLHASEEDLHVLARIFEGAGSIFNMVVQVRLLTTFDFCKADHEADLLACSAFPLRYIRYCFCLGQSSDCLRGKKIQMDGRYGRRREDQGFMRLGMRRNRRVATRPGLQKNMHIALLRSWSVPPVSE
jgi:hypothetical protein